MQIQQLFIQMAKDTVHTIDLHSGEQVEVKRIVANQTLFVS